jgi:hypothetical protein
MFPSFQRSCGFFRFARRLRGEAIRISTAGFYLHRLTSIHDLLQIGAISVQQSGCLVLVQSFSFAFSPFGFCKFFNASSKQFNDIIGT